MFGVQRAYAEGQSLLLVEARSLRDVHANPGLAHFKVLPVREAARALDAIARRDAAILRRLCMALPSAPRMQHTSDHQVLAMLKRELGVQLGRGDPPARASIYVLRDERPRTVSFGSKLEPLSPALQEDSQDHGWIVLGTYYEGEVPVQGVRIEVVLPDKRSRSLTSSDSGGARLDGIPEGDCIIRFPQLKGHDWRPDGGAPATEVTSEASTKHVVRRGECLARIAKKHGIKSWKTLWEAPENSALREKRKNAAVIRPGDEIVLPGPKIMQITRPTGALHRVIIERLEPANRLRWSV